MKEAVFVGQCVFDCERRGFSSALPGWVGVVGSGRLHMWLVVYSQEPTTTRRRSRFFNVAFGLDGYVYLFLVLMAKMDALGCDLPIIE